MRARAGFEDGDRAPRADRRIQDLRSAGLDALDCSVDFGAVASQKRQEHVVCVDWLAGIPDLGQRAEDQQVGRVELEEGRHALSVRSALDLRFSVEAGDAQSPAHDALSDALAPRAGAVALVLWWR